LVVFLSKGILSIYNSSHNAQSGGKTKSRSTYPLPPPTITGLIASFPSTKILVFAKVVKGKEPS